MSKFFAFLRAINVGGRFVKMAELRDMFVSLGFRKVETYIASGNVIFESDNTDINSLEAQIENYLFEKLGYEVIVFIRTADEIKSITHNKPVTEKDLKSAVALNIAFLKNPLDQDAIKKLMTLKTDIDDFRIQGREVYWLCRKKQSDSTFSNTVFERTLKVRTTLRGVATISKLAEKYVK